MKILQTENGEFLFQFGNDERDMAIDMLLALKPATKEFAQSIQQAVQIIESSCVEVPADGNTIH